MKKLVFCLAIGALVSAYAAESVEDNGGMLTLWPKDHGKFVFVDAQSRVKGAALETPIRALLDEFSVDIQMISQKVGTFDVRKASADVNKLGAKGAIWIVDDKELPATLVAPESGWGLVNVAVILVDSPDEKKLALRMQKFINRTFANLHGISDPIMMPGCVTKQAVGVEGVDALICATFSPEAQSKVSSYLAKAGYKQRKFGTYYDACEEGWAPAPTNAVQKAIWDKVHQLPTKPLTIKRESDRKGK